MIGQPYRRLAGQLPPPTMTTGSPGMTRHPDMRQAVAGREVTQPPGIG